MLTCRICLTGCLKMDLRKLGSVGLEVHRAYAFSFLGTLWFATGRNDNNEGTNDLFYNQNADSQWGKQGKDDIGNSGPANFFSGRLQRGTLFRNRICLLLGETLEHTNRSCPSLCICACMLPLLNVRTCEWQKQKISSSIIILSKCYWSTYTPVSK